MNTASAPGAAGSVIAHETHPALRIARLSKTFGSRRVLDDVSFVVAPGTVHALLGGNGSGKSTLVKSLAGVQSADPGGVITVGASSTGSEHVSPAWARSCGLRFVHQNPGIFPTMTVAENISIGNAMPNTAGWVRRPTLHRTCQQLLDRFQIHVSPNARMGDLRLADQTMIAIARALQDGIAGEEQISTLVLDEPTAALPEQDVEILLDAVRRATRSGVSILYISHRLDEVLSIADAVTVLRDGEEVLTRSAEGLTERELITAIVGRPITEVFPQPAAAARSNRVVAELRGVAGGPLRDVTLKVHAGEILGIAGLLGAGRSELLRTLFGSHEISAGSILVEGKQVRPKSPADAIALGIAYIPEDRGVEAAFADLTVRQNISAAEIGRYSRFGLLRHGKERAAATRSISDFKVKTRDDQALMSSLSGGNQQKVVLARWMSRRSKLLLLDEPTQGVDVGARSDAYQLVRQAVALGTAVILVSSDFEELAEMSDRVLILSDGRIAEEATGSDVTRHRLTELVFLAREETP
jgi:ribose transport system ATP-binding protein